MCSPMIKRACHRPRRWPFAVIGLTGSVAMGKSTAAAMVRRLGLPVFDADKTVHALLGPAGAALGPVSARFPAAVINNVIDRTRLGRMVFSDPAALADLEAILHPLVAERRRRFLETSALKDVRAVVLDVPLLFETHGERYCDAVMVVSAPAFLQRQRALSRPDMTAEKFAGVLARQMPDREKRRRADAVLPTGLGRRETLRHLRRALTVLTDRKI